MNITDTLQAKKWRELCDSLNLDVKIDAEEISEHVRELRWSVAS